MDAEGLINGSDWLCAELTKDRLCADKEEELVCRVAIVMVVIN